jgi:hypothetical protein
MFDASRRWYPTLSWILSAMVSPLRTGDLGLIGGADRDRTGGLLVANQALSQLSYSPQPQLLTLGPRRLAKLDLI